MAAGTVFILGSGPRIGLVVAQKFQKEGYKVAVGSRKPDVEKAQKEGFLPVTVDLGNIDAVEAAFKEVIANLGVPNIVVYNGSPFQVSRVSSHSILMQSQLLLLPGPRIQTTRSLFRQKCWKTIRQLLPLVTIPLCAKLWRASGSSRTISRRRSFLLAMSRLSPRFLQGCRWE